MKDEQRVATERANHAACPVQVRETKPGNSGVGKAANLSRETSRPLTRPSVGDSILTSIKLLAAEHAIGRF